MNWTIADYRVQYAKADGLCQEVQSFRNQAGIPAINELRNAGHHFLRSIDNDGTISSPEDLGNAISHARRAVYEATEAGIVAALAMVKKFREDYATVEVAGIIPDYVARLRSCNTAKKLIESGRQEGFDRSQDHQNRVQVFTELRAFVEDLDAGREDANKKVADSKRVARRFAIQISLALLAICITVSFGIWASTGYRHFWQSSEATKR